VDGTGSTLRASRAAIALASDGRSGPLNRQWSAGTGDVRAEYRHSSAVPSILGRPLGAVYGSALHGLRNGEVLNIPDWRQRSSNGFADAAVPKARALLAAPIVYDGRAVAVLVVEQFGRPRTFSEEEITLIGLVAELAAVAMRQAELYRAAREAATAAALLNQIVASIRRSLDLEETLQVAVNELGRALGASGVTFWKAERDTISVTAEFPGELVGGHCSAPGGAEDYRVRHLIETRRPLVLDDVRSFVVAHPGVAATVGAWQSDRASLSEIISPVFVNDAFWGALFINQTDRARRWNSSEITLIEAVTAQVEIAVSHSRLFEEARQAARREALIGRIMQEINRCSHLDEIFPILGRELGDFLDVESLIIAKLDEEASEWIVVGEYSDKKFNQPGRTHKAADVARLVEFMGGTPLLCDDVETDPRLGPYLDVLMRPAGTRAFMAVLVRHDDADRLAITAIMKSRPRVWSQEDLEILSAAADHVLAALQRAELFEQVSRGKHEWEATFDALTDGI